MRATVMFTNTFEPMIGGLERAVASLHADLNAAGHLCRIVTPSFKGADRSSGGVLRVPALTGIGSKDFSIPLPTVNRLELWMEALDPHVVHAHQPFLLGDTAWRISRLRRIPLVFTHHTLYERYAHYLPLDEDRARRLLIELTTRYANRCQLVIAPTESVRQILLDRGITVPIEVSPSGIDLRVYGGGCRARGRRALGLSEEAEVIGHVGRLSQEKNLEFLIDATIRVMKSRPQARMLLVGDGDRLAAAKARFGGESLGDRLITPGLVAGDDIADMYAAMDVFVFASHTETQGLVLAEAMAAGIPIVALDAAGTRDCVADEVVGHLLDRSVDEVAFAQAVETLLEDRPRRMSFSERAREQANKFSRPECARRHAAIYERAIYEYAAHETHATDRWEQLAERLDVEWAPFWEKLSTAFWALSGRSPLD